MNVLVIPAAGRGSRLKSTYPKVLHPVAGHAMIDYLIRRYQNVVDRFVLVINPQNERIIREHMESTQIEFGVCFQHEPTGMLDALLQSYNDSGVQNADKIWITWCDQIGISQRTVNRICEHFRILGNQPGLILPVAIKNNPYIHFKRNTANKIIQVLQRREGDSMPDLGENDCGLFAMSADVFLKDLKDYSEITNFGSGTGERNFLPFIPWYHRRGQILSFEIDNHLESIGVNDQHDMNEILDTLDIL